MRDECRACLLMNHCLGWQYGHEVHEQVQPIYVCPDVYNWFVYALGEFEVNEALNAWNVEHLTYCYRRSRLDVEESK